MHWRELGHLFHGNSVERKDSLASYLSTFGSILATLLGEKILLSIK